MKAAKVRYAAEPDESSIDRFPEQSNSSQLKRASMSDAKVQPVESFKNLYNELDKNTLTLEFLKSVYAQDIRFEDPFHAIDGLEALHDYFSELYENVREISFDWHDSVVDADQAFLTWTMTYRHPIISRGNPVAVNGVSRLVFKDGLVSSHRDYFDGGQMLYEHIPALGMIVRKLKKRLA